MLISDHILLTTTRQQLSAVHKMFLLALLFLLGSIVQLHATHLRAGQITVRRVDPNCGTRTFDITITVYTNTGSSVKFGGEDDILDFGDGNFIKVPEINNQTIPGLDPNLQVATASFTYRYTYAGTGAYVVSYREPNRNEGVLNMDRSVETRFYLETRIIVDAFLGCNASTPQLRVPPIDQACTGVAWFHNPGAYDTDGDSLSYEMVIPFSDRNTRVVNYRNPNNASFYTNFNTGNEAKSGPPQFSIDSRTGTITWDAPGMAGEYNIAFHVVEWRRVAGEWYQLGYVRRDMQIIVEDCDNERPELQIPPDLCVIAGESINEQIIGSDPDGDPITIEAFAGIFELAPAQSPAKFTKTPNPNVYDFTWDTKCLHVKEQPYQVVFKVTDSPPKGVQLATYKTWSITVVGPPPVWKSAVPDHQARSISLEWEPYQCNNADSIQIWRKVGSTDFTPGKCETGMPPNLGFELVAKVPVSGLKTFLDDNKGLGLAAGAQYCYRLVAQYPAPQGGESLVSQEICVEPIEANVPIITKVSIEETSITNGVIRVEWVAPYDLDESIVQNLVYKVRQGTGFSGAQTDVVATTSSTFAVISGLNTQDLVYNYVIDAEFNATSVGSSAPASSVRLEARSFVDRVELRWSAVVPWSNQSVDFPSHVIYRGPEGSTNEQMMEIATINPFENGFLYLDQGLEKDVTYCYRIETLGAYGDNDKLPRPLRNFSQRLCAQLGDTIPPCNPVFTVQIEGDRCQKYLETFGCENNVFSNVLTWNKPDEDCGNDIAYYILYYSNAFDGNYFELKKGIKSTSYVDDQNLTSFGRCYKVQAVDFSGNESELSEPICFDNCPNYHLPNVFTPNGDGRNDVLNAYQFRSTSETDEIQYAVDIRMYCPRFVKSVNFRVYNRWGKQVYTYSSLHGERSYYINWDGRGENGQELSSGIYYYVAEVTFDMIDPKQRKKNIKGWVHLVRGDFVEYNEP